RLIGGECSYWACMPTKTMLRAPEIRADALRTNGSLEPGPLDPQAVFAWRDLVAERDDSSQVTWLETKRCALVRGEGIVVSPGVVRIGDEELRYDRLVIATGSSPVIPPVVEGIDYWTNKEATETTEAPETLLVLGGGPVGCELAQFFARVGSRVTLVQDAERLLPRVGSLNGGAVVSRWPLTSTPRLSTYERPKRDGFVKIAADPERRVLVGAVAVGPEAGEWLQQLTLAIRAETPIEVLLDVIQPYPTFSEAVFFGLRELNLDL